MIYVQRYHGEGFEVPSGVRTRWRCCECAFVHDIVIVSQDKKPVGVAAQINLRATAASRRKKK